MNPVRPGRILMLVTNLTYGGAETQVVRLAIEWKQRGWDVRVACLIGPDAYVSQLEKHGIGIDPLGMKRGVPDFNAVLRLRTLVRKFQPDVVHCHMFHANLLGRVTRLFCRIPILVSTVHNLRETSERGGPTGYKEFLYRLTDGLGSTTTIICRAAYERYVRVGAVPAKRLHVLPNGVDTKAFSPSGARRSEARKSLGVDSEFVWLAVGRLVKQKDYPNLFRAIASIEHEDVQKFTVLIAGNGPLELELRAEVDQLGIADKVRFCGAREDIIDLYSAADAFVMSSEFEGLSVALLEASSMALPAVVTDAGGNAEIVRDGVTGYVVPVSSANELGAAMLKMMGTSKDEFERMSVSARAVCYEQYRTEAIMEQWLRLFESCLPKKVARHGFTFLPTVTNQNGGAN